MVESKTYDVKVKEALDTYCSRLVHNKDFFEGKHYYLCTDEIATYIIFSYSPGRKIRRKLKDLGFGYMQTRYINLKCWVGTDMRCFGIENYLKLNTDVKTFK